MISVCIAAYNRAEMLARTLPAHRTAADQAGEPVELIVVAGGDVCAMYDAIHALWAPYPCGVMRLDNGEPFSAGGWRTLAANAAAGDVLAITDADMLVPPDYLSALVPLARTHGAVFPTYQREIHPGGEQRFGRGTGNVIMTRQTWEGVLAATDGKGYWYSVKWGGEDTRMANTVIKVTGHPMVRPRPAGFVHLWHLKAGSLWYSGSNVLPP